MMRQPAEAASLPKMVLSSSSRKALSSIDGWLAEKRDLGKAVFSAPPLACCKEGLRGFQFLSLDHGGLG